MDNSQDKAKFSLDSLNPAGVCTLVTIIAIIGAFAGLATKNPCGFCFFYYRQQSTGYPHPRRSFN